ncbi:hypothetical protein QEJ31_15535 [Pigmentibacter sp. JX0631]|uniref:hypothetical protein n=1 Tax=Pigmentibacter sp. JX0631 TaxID=2976982 RepID=UPI0024692E37|nr:hypothetical protein [Pigmentibacter sp. JX0631]WGL59944.1 hypothetical protein QEJ31_15535 [Pigmentibacter sp. JX0631]
MKFYFKLLSLIYCLFFCQAKAVQIIQLGVEDVNFFPIYGTYDGNDNKLLEYDGYSADIFRLFNKSQNKYEIKFNPVQIKRLFLEFLDPKSILDAKYPDDPNWAMDLKKSKGLKIYYSLPVIKYTDGVFVLKENQKNDITKIKTLGMILGFSPIGYEEYIKSGKIKLEQTINVKILFDWLINKKVDAIYISKSIGECKLNILKYSDKIVFNDKLPVLSGSYRLSSIKYPELIKDFDIFLNKKKNFLGQMQKNITKFKCH